MGRIPDLLLIGDGRLARHLTRYFEQLGLSHTAWSRRMHAGGRCPELKALVHSSTRALLAISDRAIEPFILAHPELDSAVRVHFSGRLASPLAIGAHPLFSFAGTLYEREFYERIPFVLDQGSPPLASLIPGLPNPSFFIEPERRSRYHALCVLAGNFTTLLWSKFFFELDWELGIAHEQALPFLESVTRGLAGKSAPLSGPLSRGDHVTLQCNLEALKGDPFEEVYRAFVSAYERQGRLTALRGRKERAGQMNVLDFQTMKDEGRKISMVTCYDYSSARAVAESSVDCILVGDSLAMTMHGHPNTLSATTAMMALHTAAVARGAPSKFIVADLPFLSYRKGLKEAMDSVHELMSAGAHAVKLEGVRGHAEIVRHIVDSGVPVMGHLGLTPQSVNLLGGMRVQARTDSEADLLASQARELEEAGCFSLVLECVPSEAARKVTDLLKIPTIGIGAGPRVSGQVLVYQDLLGLNPGFKPRFLRTYANAFEVILDALDTYDRDVKNGEFPSESESYESHPIDRPVAKSADGISRRHRRLCSDHGRAPRRARHAAPALARRV